MSFLLERATVALLASTLCGVSDALAGDWKDCTMLWAEVNVAGQDGDRLVTQEVRFNPSAQVMKFEKLALEAHVMDANTVFLDDDTRVTLNLWKENGDYRMTYVWHDMSDGTQTEIYGEQRFFPNIIFLANFFGGQLTCE